MLLYTRDLQNSTRNNKHIQQCDRIYNQFTQINSFSIDHQQTFREGDHGSTLVPNSLKDNKTSGNKLNSGCEGLLGWNFRPLEKETEKDTRKWKQYPKHVVW